MDELKTSIEYIKGIGPNRAKLMREELNISNYVDLLTFFKYISVRLRKEHTSTPFLYYIITNIILL